MRKITACFFFLYVAAAALLLFGRDAQVSLTVSEYFLSCANPIPLRTLARYLSFFIRRRDRRSFLLCLSNIGGNFLLFLPMGFFLPTLFKAVRTEGRCLLAVFFTVLGAELLQGILRVGIPDVDDLLLNMLGAYVGFRLRGRMMRSEAKSL